MIYQLLTSVHLPDLARKAYQRRKMEEKGGGGGFFLTVDAATKIHFQY